MNKKQLLILIVDDNVRFVERMAGLLSENHDIYRIRVANDYEEVKSICSDENEEMPDLVLLDINLPGRNGIEVLKLIKQSGWSSKVIMITNHADEYYRAQCRDLGADHFLDKSNDFSLVPNLINELDLI